MTNREIDALVAEKVMGLNPSADFEGYQQFLNANLV